MRARLKFFMLVSAAVLSGCSGQQQAHDQTRGDTAQSDDMREPVRLGAHERTIVLAEMRQMLESTAGVVSGLAARDMRAVQTAAAQAGRRAPGTVDGALHGNLPENFRRMGAAMHGGFDDIARMANDGADSAAVTAKLGEVLNQCTTCHATYRIEEGH